MNSPKNKKLLIWSTKLLLTFSLFFSVSFMWGQSTIFIEEFNNNSSFSASPDGFYSDGANGYFGIYDAASNTDNFGAGTEPTGITTDDTTFTGNYLVGEDLDRTAPNSDTQSIIWSSIDIRNFSSMSVSGNFASSGSGVFDGPDNIIIEVSIDGGAYTKVLAFEADGDQSNEDLAVDSDLDGQGDGAKLTTSAANYSASIVGTGTSMDIKLTVSLNSSGEEVAIDDIKLEGTFDNDTDSDVGEGTQPTESTISSLSTSAGSATDVFVLDFYDWGGDGLTTKVTNIHLTKKATNTADWTDTLQGFIVHDGSSDKTPDSVIITDTYIDIGFNSGNFVVADGSTPTVTIKAFLKNSNINDGEILSFRVEADHGFTADYSGSIFTDTFTAFDSKDFSIVVEATELQFLQQPSNVAVNALMTPAVKVAYTDANGNIDLDYDSVGVTASLSATGADLVGTTIDGTPVNGIMTFSTIKFTTTGIDVTLSVHDNDNITNTNITSNPFIVGLVADECSQLFISEYANIGGGNYVEIYNPTASAVDLSNYQLRRGVNGGSWGSADIFTFTMSATLASGDVYTFARTGEIPEANQHEDRMDYNGDDNIGLFYNGGSGSVFTLIDAVGDDQGDPAGNGWNVAGVTDATYEHSMMRKKSVNKPNTNWGDSAGTNDTNSEWIVSSYTQANLFFHHSTCNYYPCEATEEVALLLDFESAGGYTPTPNEFNGGVNSYVYFERNTEANFGSAVDLTFISGQGSYCFGVQDTDGTANNYDPVSFVIDPITITSLENLKFSILIAEDDASSGEDWDTDTNMYITYSIDDGPTPAYDKNLLWVESLWDTDGDGFDRAPAVDVDFNGTGNSNYTITDTFQEFTKDILGTGNTLYIKVVFSDLDNGTEDIAIDNIKVTGDRIPLSTYESSAWDTTPAIGRKAIIKENYNTSAGNISSCRCEVVSGNTLTVDASHYLLVAGAIENEGHIVVQHEGSLVQLDDHATNIGSGDYKIHKTTPQYADYDYIYWSSPVDNETIGSVLSGSHASYRFKLSTADYLDLYGGYGHPQTAGSSDSFDDNNDDWVHVPSGEIMEKGKGYISMGEGSDFPLDFDNIETDNIQSVIFDGGKVNNGVITVAVTLDKYNQDNADAPGTYSGADSFHTNVNLLGNPYPSAIDIAALRTDDANAAILEGTFYFWTHDTQIATGGGPWAYNFTNDDYATITVDAGGVFSQVGAGNGAGTNASQFIASGQGFMASVTDNGVVTFNNAMRVTGDNNHFLKQSSARTQVDKICLNFTEPNSFLIRQALVGFYDTATDTYQAGQDGMRLENGQNTDFYSLIPEDTRHFAIQNLATFNDAKIVSLGIEIAEAGSFEIGINYVTGVFETQDVYLLDKRTGILHNLSQSGVYKFDILDIELGGELNDRFELRFVDGAASTQDDLMDRLSIYPNPSKGVFNINIPTQEKLTISIFDISGKLVKRINNVKDKQIDLSVYAKGIYFAKIDINGVQTVKKIVLK